MSGAPEDRGTEDPRWGTVYRAIGNGIPWHDPMSCQGAGCTDDHDEKEARTALESLRAELAEVVAERDAAVGEKAAWAGMTERAEARASKAYASVEATEARVEELLVKWSEAKYATEAAEAERDKARLLTEAEKEISAGAIQAMRAAEAKLRVANELGRWDPEDKARTEDALAAAEAKVTALGAALREAVADHDAQVGALVEGMPKDTKRHYLDSPWVVDARAALDRQES